MERRLQPITENQFKAILNKAKYMPKQIMENAGDIGNQAHKCLENSIKHAMKEYDGVVGYTIDNPTHEHAINCVNAAFDWMKKHRVKWLHSERLVYSKTYDYCGTMDGLAYVSSCHDRDCCPFPFENVLSLIDWKSSNGLWVDYLYQTAGYQAAYEEETEEQVVDRWILRLGKNDGVFEPWHLTPGDFEFDYQGFLECLALTRTHKLVTARMEALKKKRWRESKKKK